MHASDSKNTKTSNASSPHRKFASPMDQMHAKSCHTSFRFVISQHTCTVGQHQGQPSEDPFQIVWSLWGTEVPGAHLRPVPGARLRPLATPLGSIQNLVPLVHNRFTVIHWLKDSIGFRLFLLLSLGPRWFLFVSTGSYRFLLIPTSC